MSVRQAEADAAEFLNNSWSVTYGDEFPVDPMRLARSLGIRVEYERLPSDLSGRIIMRAGGDAVITLNSLDHENRQRFTCAHEIGHYWSRREHGHQQFEDRRSTLAGMGVDDNEIYANQFAAALLMPASAVQKENWRGKPVWAMAKHFGTSTQAMELRLRNLGLSS